jgi:hypothetical protein
MSYGEVVQPPRTARLVLVTPDGSVVGSLPAVPVSTPWWPDVEPVVRAVRDRYGIDVIVLRLLEATSERAVGGDVTYLAEVARPVPAEPWHGPLDDQPLRHAFAKPGGPTADLAWAESVLARRGLRPTERPVQVKTWNLSSVWRIPVNGQTIWLKVVPPFFAHEGPVLNRLAGQHVPTLIGHEGGRCLFADIAGQDLPHAELPLLLEMVTLLVDLQGQWVGRVDELLALGLPDWRAAALTAAICEVIQTTADELSVADRATLDGFARTLPDRFAEVAACGPGDALVHGDFWPGNVRGDEHELTLLDWGDCGVGHPLLDQSAFLDRIPRGAVRAVRRHWVERWRAAAPGSDPARAMILLAPVAAARQAVVYRHFLECIEPAEQPYHRSDPAARLRRTATLVRAERGQSLG